jgi:hypothetical protein
MRFVDQTGASSNQIVWVSMRETTAEAWSTPVNLGAPINSPFNDIQAFVSSDRKALFFASDRPGGFDAFDLYASVRSSIHDPD